MTLCLGKTETIIIITLLMIALVANHIPIFSEQEQQEQEVNKPVNNYTSMCSPVYIIMQQWLNDPNELKCHNT